MAKHILFGLNNSSDRKFENAILNIYTQELGKEFTYDSEYYLQGINKNLSDNHYDLLILREDLEGIANPVTVEFMDKITDKHPQLRIILIIENEHEKDNYVKRLFNLGIYDILYKEDAAIEEIVELIETPRSKMKAKIYLDIDEIQDLSRENNLEEMPDEELEQILLHLNQATQDTISEIFDEINRQYNDKQMLFLFTLLPLEVIKMLSETGNSNFEKLHKKWMIIEGKYNHIDDEEKETTTKEKIKTKVVTKVEKQYIHSIPKDYNKIAAFIGNRKVGTTTIVDLVANEFSRKGKKVVVLDLTKSKTLFYSKCWGNESITEEEKRGLSLLNKGIKHPIIVNENYTLYTQIGNGLEDFDFFNSIEQIRYDNDIILIDMDFNSRYEWLKYGVTALYLVQDLNIMDILETKEHLKKILSAGVNGKKIHLIANKVVKCKVKPEDIIHSFKEPIPYLEFDSKANYLSINSEVLKVGFDENFYKELLTSYMYVDEKLKLTDGIKEQIQNICNDIYPMDKTEKGKGFLNLGRVFKFGK